MIIKKLSTLKNSKMLITTNFNKKNRRVINIEA